MQNLSVKKLVFLFVNHQESAFPLIDESSVARNLILLSNGYCATIAAKVFAAEVFAAILKNQQNC